GGLLVEVPAWVVPAVLLEDGGGARHVPIDVMEAAEPHQREPGLGDARADVGRAAVEAACGVEPTLVVIHVRHEEEGLGRGALPRIPLSRAQEGGPGVLDAALPVLQPPDLEERVGRYGRRGCALR